MFFLFQCRIGFEADAAAEVEAMGKAWRLPVHCRFAPDAAFVQADVGERAAETVYEALQLRELVFVRQWCRVRQAVGDLPDKERLAPLRQAACDVRGRRPAAFADVLLENPDTNEGKTLIRWCLQVRERLEDGLRDDGVLESRKADGGTDAAADEAGRGVRKRSAAAWAERDGAERLHLFLPDWQHAWLGTSPVGASSPWPSGIPRLRLPAESPSRATLKLEEAFRVLLAPAEAKRWLRAGMHAVDLGAAPGGWTQVLAQHGLKVIAVDNAELDRRALSGGAVLHVRDNAYRYRPPRAADWVTCDVVDRPTHVVPLMARWIGDGWARRAVFNLKLPMKQRWAMVQGCLAGLRERLLAYGLDGDSYILRAKQLYHDRQEVTVLLARVGNAQGAGTGRDERRVSRGEQATGDGVANAQHPAPNAQRRTPGTQRPAPSAQRPTPGTQRPAPNAQRRTPGSQRPAPNAQRRTPGAQRQAPNVQRRTPSAERRRPGARPSRPRSGHGG